MSPFLRLKFHSARLAVPATMLLLLLQRTPLLRWLANPEFIGGGRVGQILRAMVPSALALGATHTLTGQTRWTTNPAGTTTAVTVPGQVGSPLSVTFAFGGGSTTPESYSIVGTLPAGLSVPNATGPAGNLTLNSSQGGGVTGTPTQAGSFSLTLTAFDSPNRGQGQHGSSPTFALNFNIQSTTAPPAFTTHPQTQTVAFRSDVTFTVAVSGSPTPTLQWRKGGVAISGATSATLSLTDVGLDAAGTYDCVATNSEGNADSNDATLTVTAPAMPVIDTQPIAITCRQNSGAFFSTMATGVELTYQWRKDGVNLSGQTKSSLFLDNVTTANEGNYSVRVTNPAGSVDSNAVPLDVVSSGNARLVNLSARAMVGTGANILIPGFVIGGTGTKNILVRTIGPKLTDFGVGGVLADPRMQLFRDATAGEQNDDWGQFANQTLLESTRAAVSAFELTPSTKDSAMVVSLNAGIINYTVQASGVGNTTGVGLVEFYDADAPNPSARFINISARAQVGTGNDVLIPGFFIEGNVALTLLIRGVGPTLGADPFNVPGTLQDPVLTLFRNLASPQGGQEVMTTNDNWEETPNPTAMEAVRAATSAFGLGAGRADGALLVALNPGGYTVKVEGKNSGTGVALMEIYLVGP